MACGIRHCGENANMGYAEFNAMTPTTLDPEEAQDGGDVPRLRNDPGFLPVGSERDDNPVITARGPVLMQLTLEMRAAAPDDEALTKLTTAMTALKASVEDRGHRGKARDVFRTCFALVMRQWIILSRVLF